MSKDQTDTHLRYGQGIIIKGYKPEKDPDQGFLTVRGFADTRANYETISNILYFKNYRNAIFELIPAGNFQINDQLYKLESKIVDNKEEQQQLAKTIRTLQIRAKSQQIQFQLGIKRKNKSTIKFGDFVMLRHVDSETYLSGTIRPSEGTNGAFSVQVSSRLSKALVFQLLPYRSFESESMQIPFSSPLLIKNVYNNGYLTFQKLGVVQDNSHLHRYMEKVPTKSDKSYRIPVKTDTKDSKVFEVVTYFVDLSIEVTNPMPWQFQIHFNEVQNDSLIQHDIVYLKHTQNNGILSAIGQNIMLKQSKNEGVQGLQFYESLWQIQKMSSDSQNTYILRHLMSGMTLGVRRSQDQENIPVEAALIDISQGDGNCQLGTIDLQLAKKDGGQINSESFIYLKCDNYILDCYEQQETIQMKSMIRSSAIANTQDLINLDRMKKLAKNQAEYTIKPLRFTEDIPKNCFVILQIEDDLKKQLLFALSFHSTIINLREDLKWGATDAMKKITYIRMMKVTQKICEINDFLKGCEPNDPEKQFKIPIVKRQMICKDLGLSQLLFELLFYMRQNMKQEIFKEKVNQKQKFYEMHQKIYTVIINLIKDNRIFKIHVSKWILFIFEDFIQKNETIHYEVLMQLLKNNEFFLDNFVTPQLITFLLQNMLKQKNNKKFTQKRYIDVFRALCLVGDKVFALNQNLILKYFIQKLESMPDGANYQIKFIHNNDQIYCSVALDKKNLTEYKFQQFKQLSKQVDQNGVPKYPNSWEYYVSYLNLLADITKGRSKSVEKYVKKQLPIQMLTLLFDRYQIDQFEVPVIKILHYLYCENENFYPIDRQNRIVPYDSILSSEIAISHFVGKESPWNIMGTVLQKLKVKLSQMGPIPPRSADPQEDSKLYLQNQILLELLLFTRQTLNLGFWLEKKDLQEIYQYMLKILQKHPFIDYKQVSKVNKYNQLMITCKLECLNIIQLIINQDMIVSLQIYNKIFREFDIPQQRYNFDENPTLIPSQGETPFAHEFIQKTSEKEKQFEPIVNRTIYTQMIQLSNYSNPQLTSKSLEILSQVLNSEKHKMNKFYAQLFVCQPDCVMLAQFLTELKNKFFILEDINTTKITYQNQNENYISIYTEHLGPYQKNNHSSIMHDMFMITELMKNQNSLSNVQKIPTLDSSGVFAKLGTDRLINFTDCRKSSSLIKQKIVDATNIHLKILAFMLNCHEVPDSQLAVKLLHLCYNFIVGLIENHQQMKPKIVPYLPQLMRHLKQNVGCIDLLRQMYDNNKGMLYNQTQIVSLIRLLCDIINKQSNIAYKAKLMDFFRYLIYLNGKCLKNNQILILKILQDDDYTNILQIVTPDIIRNLVANFNLMNDNGEFPDNVVKCQPDLIYITSYFQVLVSLIDQGNSVNIGKLVKRFPFEMLAECISAAGECWMVKRNLRAFINRMYYFSVGTNIYLSLIIKNQIPTIIQDLDRFIAIKLKSEEQTGKLQQIKFEQPLRFTYLQSYFYLNLQQNLFTLFSMFNTSQLFQQLLQILKTQTQPSDFSTNLIRIAQRLGYVRKWFTKFCNIHTVGIIKFLQDRLSKLLQAMRIGVYGQGVKISQYNRQEQQKVKNAIIHKILQGQIGEFYQKGSTRYKQKVPLVYNIEDKPVQLKITHQKDEQKLYKLMRKIFSRKKPQFQNRDEEAHDKMEKLVIAIKISKNIKQKFIKSFEDNLTDCYHKGGTEQLFNFITILIDINEQDPEILPQELKIFILKIITSLYYEANKAEETVNINQEKQAPEKKQQLMKQEQVGEPIPIQEAVEQKQIKEIDEWQAEQWQQNAQKITSLQHRLMECRVGSFITSLIKGNISNNVHLANEILLCSIAYMLGGNPETQNNIRQQLNKDPQNKLLLNIKKLINILGVLIKKNIDFQEKTGAGEEAYIADFNVNYVDNYDYYDIGQKFTTRKNVSQPRYIDQILYFKECIVTYRRAFKFLQLLCQNNNIQNKNFIRQQPQKSQSIDFIQIATKQLRNIFQILNTTICEVPNFILDFILQVTQIPVKPNQEALIRSSFFEDVCEMSVWVSKSEQMAKRGFDVDREHIDEIFQKFVQIILSNFEGNSPQYFRQLDEKLQPNFLVKLLKYNLELIGVKSKSDFDAFVEKMKEPKMVDGKLQAKGFFDDSVCSVLQLIIIFIKLKQVVGQQSKIYSAYLKQKALKDRFQSKVNEQLFNELQNCLLKIQINDQNNCNQNVYFPKHPCFASISSNLKDYVMKNVKRSTHKQKIVSLLGYVSGIREKMLEAYNYQICYNLSETVMRNYYYYSSRLSFLICLYMIFFYNVYIEYGEAEFTSSWPIVIIRFLMSLLQLYLSFKYAYSWYKLKQWSKPEPISRQSKKNVQIAQQILRHSTTLEAPQSQFATKFPKIANFLQQLKLKFGNYMQIAQQKVPKVKEIRQQISQFWEAFAPSDPDQPKIYQSGQFIRILIYVLVSVIGTFFYPTVFFIHIIDLVCSIDYLGNIFQAISLVIEPLMYVSLMGIAFVAVFSSITFSNYMKDIYGDTTNQNEMCTNPLSCVLALFVSGAIGETMGKFEIVRFGYDMIYFIFFDLLFGNIVSGFMLDAFGSLGQTLDQLNQDKKNLCYVCNKKRQQMQKDGQKFEDHIAHKHHLWNYILYIVALQTKNETDFTGLEYYISQKYNLPDEQMDETWIPNGESGDSEQFDKQPAIMQLIGQITEGAEQNQQKIGNLETKIEQFNKQASSLVQQ